MSLTLLVAVAACSGGAKEPARSSAAKAVATADGPQALPSRRPHTIHALVQLTERPTAAVYRGRLTTLRATTTDGTATASATDAAVQQLAYVNAEQDAVATTVASVLPDAKEVFRLQRIYNGIVYTTDEAGLARLRALPGVRAVHELTLHTVDNARGVPLVGATQLWSLGVPVRGDGIKVGVIDTGIDYTHANFGGPGTAAAYAANDPNLVEPGTFPTAKVVGGWDFAGGNYDAAEDATSFPIPDADPLDHGGHGSHVAGTVAGFGVNLDGSTYAGPYDSTLDPTTLRIGPGAAPGAQLYALKVFGDIGGSTSLAAQAVEWATDPNGDGDFSDHLDVVNLSLGSSYGSPDDSEAVFYTNAVNAGVVVVASAGNSNDVYFVTGAPAATPAVISVAASSTGASPAIRVNAPASLAGLKSAGTGNPAAPLPAPLTGDVVLATTTGTTDPNDGCAPLTNAADVAGKIAFIHRGTCSFVIKATNAQAAGAIGFIIANVPSSGWPITMALDATITIPGFIIQNVDREAFEAALANGPVNVTFDNLLVAQDPNAVDTVASFTSRGPTRRAGQPMLKPDVAAPGLNVVSTAMGTGSGSETMSGTSMASPLTAGVMALLKQLHPDWTPAELKALVMNTAGHDVFNANLGVTGRTRFGPGRVGAGRIDAAAASGATVLAYDKAAPDRVSVSFTTVDVPALRTETRTLQLKNKGTADVTYDVTVSTAVAPPGVTVAAGAPTVTVTAGTTADVPLVLTADPVAMTRKRDPTASNAGATPFGNMYRDWLSETSGWVVFTPQGGGTALRVPYYATPIPASAMTSSSPLATTGPTGSSDLTLSGTGVDTRGIAAIPTGVVSLATPFELAYASPRAAPLGGPLPVGLPSAEADLANLRYVGITSNAADLGGDLASAELYFAINTWAAWGSLADVEFDVYLRQAGAPGWEYVLYNYDLGLFTANSPYTDVHFTILQNLATGSVSAEDYVNGIAAGQIFVPAYLTDTAVLPVYVADVLSPGTTALEYQVMAFSRQSGLVDATPVLRYDVAAPAFATTIDPALTTLGPGYTPFRVDAPAATVSVAYDLDRARATATGGLLLVHHHNALGQRAEFVPVQGLTCAAAADCAGTPATPVCDALSGACVGCTGNADCASGYCDVFGTRTCKAADCRNVDGPICPAHYACSADYGRCEANQAMIGTVVVPPNTTCPAGGLQINTGFDDNHDGALNASEVLSTNYVCNGQSATVSAEAAGANCATGGVRIQVGTAAPTYVCNGATGATGADGQSVTATPEPAGANCANGGVKVQVGTTGTPTYVCNGTNGADGQSASVTPEPAGANCANGGVRVQVGTGTPAYVCDGATGSTGAAGADGQSATVTPEPAGANCANGGLRVQVGSGAPSYVCNGATGATGPTGPKGSSGGCASVDGTSALSLLGLGALIWRRRRRGAKAA